MTRAGGVGPGVGNGAGAADRGAGSETGSGAENGVGSEVADRGAGSGAGCGAENVLSSCPMRISLQLIRLRCKQNAFRSFVSKCNVTSLTDWLK